MARKIEDCTMGTVIEAIPGMRALAAASVEPGLAYKILCLSQDMESEIKKYEVLRRGIESEEDLTDQEKSTKMADLVNVEVTSEFRTLNLDTLLESGVSISAGLSVTVQSARPGSPGSRVPPASRSSKTVPVIFASSCTPKSWPVWFSPSAVIVVV